MLILCYILGLFLVSCGIVIHDGGNQQAIGAAFWIFGAGVIILIGVLAVHKYLKGPSI